MSSNYEPQRPESRLALPGDPEFEMELAHMALGPLMGTSLAGSVSPMDFLDKLPYFNREERQDIFNATRNAVEYADQNEVSALVLIDKSARLMWVSFKEYWKRTHNEGQPAPDIFFVEPDGFKKLRWEWDADVKRDEMEADHPYLNKHKDGTVLVLDTCIHEGETAGSILEVMSDCGFEDVRLAVLDGRRNISHIEPDAVLLNKKPASPCFPFGEVGLVTEPRHNDDHLYSKRWLRQDGSPARIRGVRDEIRRIVRDNLLIEG